MKLRSLIISILILFIGFAASFAIFQEFRIWKLNKASGRNMKIREGMTCSEVQALLGEPTCVFKTNSKELMSAVWLLREGRLRPEIRWKLEDLEKEQDSVLVYEYLKWIYTSPLRDNCYGFYTAIIFNEETGRVILKRHIDFGSWIDLFKILDYRKLESEKRITTLKE